MNLKTIKICRSCKSPKIDGVLSLGKQYLSDFIDKKEKNELPRLPLELVLCNDCKLLQLKHIVPKAFLYTERYGYKSGINETIKNDLNSIVQDTLDLLETDGPKEKQAWLDIGGNDGTLLSFVPGKFTKVNVEPIQKFANESADVADIVINGFFSYKAVRQQTQEFFDAITAISMFYDLDEPSVFLNEIKKLLTPEGVFIIQQNYLGAMIQQNAFDNIVHEHSVYYSLYSLENLLRKNGLDIFRVKLNDINGGSFRTFICHKGAREIEPSVFALRSMEQALSLDKRSTYQAFSGRIREISNRLKKFIKKEVKAGRKIILFGASTRGNTILQACGLDASLVRAASERNPEKWGKKISSVGIPIISEAEARVEEPDYFLVLPWFHFFPEMFEREMAYLEKGGKFLLPLPYPYIVGRDRDKIPI